MIKPNWYYRVDKQVSLPILIQINGNFAFTRKQNNIEQAYTYSSNKDFCFKLFGIRKVQFVIVQKAQNMHFILKNLKYLSVSVQIIIMNAE